MSWQVRLQMVVEPFFTYWRVNYVCEVHIMCISVCKSEYCETIESNSAVLLFDRTQAYIDQQLMIPLSSGHSLDHAAICGLDGGIWAQSENFPGLSDAECELILKGFEDIGILGEKGVTIGGSKYMLIASDAEGGVIRGKNGPSGLTIKKTNSALVIGIHGEKVTPGECNLLVENLADYLKEQGI